MLTGTTVLASESVGTAVMVFLGVAVSVAGRLRGATAVAGAAGWAAAVFVGASLADASGAHLNPAITIAQAASGRTGWELVPIYLLGQLTGALVGSAAVVAGFWSAVRGQPPGADVVTWFATSSQDRSRTRSIVTETLATCVLVTWVLNPPQPSVQDGVFNFGNTGLGYAGVAIVVFVLSLGAGSPTAAALNPVRDLGPRLVYTLLLRNRTGGSAHWSYAPVPVVGPLLGAALAVAVSAILPAAG